MERSIIIGLVVFTLFMAWTWWRRRGAGGVSFDRDDPRLAAAKGEARRSLPEFWAALDGGGPAHDGFMIKFTLNHDPNAGPEANSESIWAGDIERRDGRIFGTLVNSPFDPAFQAGQRVEFTEAAIDDWSYWDTSSGKPVARGHFVTRLMIEVAPARVAARQKAELGWG